MPFHLANSQDIEGYGTTCSIIAGSLLGAARRLEAKGVPSTVISESFEHASEKAVKIMIHRKLKDRESGTTALNSEVVSLHSMILSTAVVDAIMKVIDLNGYISVHLKDIKVMKQQSDTAFEVKLIDGLLFKQEEASLGFGWSKVEKAKIGVIQFCIPPKTNMDNRIVVSTQLDTVLLEERFNLLENIVKQVKKAGCNVLLVQKSILCEAMNDLALYFFDKMKIMVIRYIEREDVERICKTLNCRPIASLDDFVPEALGSADLVEGFEEGGVKYVKVTGVPNPGETVTLFLGSYNPLVLEETERSLHHAVCVVKSFIAAVQHRCNIKRYFT